MNTIRLARPALSLLSTLGSKFQSVQPRLNTHPSSNYVYTANSTRLISCSSSLWKKQKPSDSKIKKDLDNDEEDDYEDLEDEGNDEKDLLDSIDTSEYPSGFKVMAKFVASLRFDTILAAGLGVSRNKIDTDFYSSRLRLNGEKVLKKSVLVTEKAELDLVAEMDDKTKKRRIKRVLLYQILNEKSKKSNKTKVIMVVWKNGIFEDEAYKTAKKKW